MNVDIAPGVSLPRERVGESRRKSRIVSGLGDDANPKRVDVGASARRKGPSDLFAHQLGKTVAVRRIGVLVLIDGEAGVVSVTLRKADAVGRYAQGYDDFADAKFGGRFDDVVG
jgi:hypothetical protein